MKNALLILTLIFSISCGKAQSDSAKNNASINSENNKTTYYFVRHAEKNLSDSSNPKLTKAGQERAKKLANYFKDKRINAVYSTNFNRTRSTAKPTANSKKLKTIIYNPSSFDYKRFLEDTKGKSILIVGHSNTIPSFINKIIGENKYEEIDENNYSNLYIVTIENDKINSELISQD